MQLETISTGDLSFTEKVNRNFSILSQVNSGMREVEVSIGHGLTVIFRRIGQDIEMMIPAFYSIYLSKEEHKDHYVSEMIPMAFRPSTTLSIDRVSIYSTLYGMVFDDVNFVFYPDGRIKWVFRPIQDVYKYDSKDHHTRGKGALYGIFPGLYYWKKILFPTSGNSPMIQSGDLEIVQAIQDEFQKYQRNLPVVLGAEYILDLGCQVYALCRRYGNKVTLMCTQYRHCRDFNVKNPLVYDVKKSIPMGFKPNKISQTDFFARNGTAEVFESYGSPEKWRYRLKSVGKLVFQTDGRILWQRNGEYEIPTILPFCLSWITSDPFPSEHAIYKI